MKCLIINGSPSKSYSFGNGTTTSFTAKLTDEVKSSMSKLTAVEFEEIKLVDVNIPYCKGCYNCFLKGENSCPYSEFVQPIIEKIKEADCLIFTSPVYAMNVSALVKNFIDVTAYNYHRSSFFDKKALVIGSTAGAAAKSVCKYMRDVLKYWGFNSVYSLSVIRMGANDLNDKMRKKCRLSAQKLYKAATSELRQPSFKRVFFYQVWRASSINNSGADHDYWEKSGLVKYDYAPIIKLGIIKRIFAKAMFNLLKKAMK